MNYERNKKGARFFETQCSVGQIVQTELATFFRSVIYVSANQRFLRATAMLRES